MAKSTFRYYEAGYYFTCGAPAGSPPVPQQRIVIARGMTTMKEALEELSEIARSVQLLAEAVNAQGRANRLTYVPIPALGWFVEPVYSRLQRVSLELTKPAARAA